MCFRLQVAPSGKATEVSAGLAESNGSLLPGLWRDSLHVTCGLTACTPGSAPGPTLGTEYGKTLPFLFSKMAHTSLTSFRSTLAPPSLRHSHGHRIDVYVCIYLSICMYLSYLDTYTTTNRNCSRSCRRHRSFPKSQSQILSSLCLPNQSQRSRSSALANYVSSAVRIGYLNFGE